MRNPPRVLFFTLLIVVLFVQCRRIENGVLVQGWADLPAILARIVPPQFPDRDFDITAFGARGDGKSDCTEAFRKAINECSAAGGGRVVVHKGVFLSGPIHLKSNVNLHISEEAVVKFTTNSEAYAGLVYTRWEGVECLNYSPLIYAFEQENIAVTGKGTLDGQATNENWWSWKGNADDGWKKGMPNQKNARNALFAMAEKNVPVAERVFGEGHYLRPNFIQPYRCKNVLIQDVTLKDSPMWFIHPVLCTNVTVKDVTVNGLGPNNDGCNPESSKDVLIKDCFFNTGDDCIAIKSGRNADGRRVNVPGENIVIQGCNMKEGHGGVVLGSEISGGVRNVFAEDCVMDSPNLERALRFKTNSVRGGIMENFFARNICVGEVSEAVLKIDFFYEEGDAGEFTPVVRNLSITDLTCEKGKYAVWVKGYERSPIKNLRLERCQFDGIAEPNVIEAVDGFSLADVTLNGKPMK
ncbi:MAG TPA: glycoside hydrolase family 28 protein [Bacteroidota bacterium]|nr:glycoside hydrolase family 28 protein [Bacteroidota bacterium]